MDARILLGMSQRQELQHLFGNLSDEELVASGSSGELTDLAQEVANAEARSRGLSFHPRTVVPDDPATLPAVYHGDMQIVARHLTPAEAHMLASTLHAGGVPAEAGDTNLVQANSPGTAAVGGACVRVPVEFLAEATELIAALQRGDFAPGGDFDVQA